MKTTPVTLASTRPASKSNTSSAQSNEHSTSARSKRRSERRPLNAVVRVYGNTEGGKSFYEEARTINVSMHGALMEAKIDAGVGQKLMLINEATERQQICKIVNIRKIDAEASVIAVEFPVPHAEFWNVFSSRGEVRPSTKKDEAIVDKADLAICLSRS